MFDLKILIFLFVNFNLIATNPFSNFTQAYLAVYRPQTPERPYPYVDEEIKFKNNKANISLAGTLTYKNNTKHRYCVVLAHASGGHLRDEIISNHHIFMVLADYLTRNSIVVLRFDERGLGESSGNYYETNYQDLADDVLAGVEYMKKRNEFKRCKFGIIGHSKGGVTGMIAANSSNLIQFLVLLASPASDATKLLNRQTKLVHELLNASQSTINSYLEFNKIAFDLIKTTENRKLLMRELIKYSHEIINSTDKEHIAFLLQPWFKDLLLFNFRDILSQIKIPLLGLYGSLDMHVTADENLNGLKDGLKYAKNHKYKLIKFNKLNHLFQTAITGSPSEFGIIKETIAPIVLKTISNWIKNIV